PSTTVAVRSDARPNLVGSGRHKRLPATPMPSGQGARAGRLQGLPDRTPPAGARGKARLLPRGEGTDPLAALSPLRAPAALVTSDGVGIADARRPSWLG